MKKSIKKYCNELFTMLKNVVELEVRKNRVNNQLRFIRKGLEYKTFGIYRTFIYGLTKNNIYLAYYS